MSGQALNPELSETLEKPEFEPLKNAYGNLGLVKDILSNAEEVHYLGQFKKLYYYLIKAVDASTGGRIAWIVRVAKNGYLKSATSIPYSMWKKVAEHLAH